MFTIYQELRIPEDQRQAFERERTACVIGRDLANKYNFKLGDRIHLVGDIYPGDFEFTVRGIFDSPMPSQVMYFSREYLEQSLPERRRGNAGTFVILLDSPSSATRVAETIDDEFHNSTAQTKTESEQAYVLGFVSLLGNVKMFLIGISAAVMFTILLVSANTMAMSVRERVREVGVLKTLGFTPGTILGMILGEACAISLVGGTHRLPALDDADQRRRQEPGGNVSAARSGVRPRGRGGLHPHRRRHRLAQLAGAGHGRLAHVHRRRPAQHGLTPWPSPSPTICGTWWCARPLPS